jgi:hypothetical protein
MHRAKAGNHQARNCQFFAGRATDRLVVSELTLPEIAATPNEQMCAAMSGVAERCEAVSVTPDADRLAMRYIEAGAVSESFSADAYHVAIAVVCGADCHRELEL